MAPVKIYGIPASTCVARVLTCLEEKGVEYEIVPINMAAGEHKRHPFLAKNPFGQIPAVEIDNLTLFESRAINGVLTYKYKDIGTDLLHHNNFEERASVAVWSEVESQQFNPVISPIIYQHFIIPMHGGTADQSVIDANVEKLGKVLDVYEERLSKNKYLAGNFYSLADLHHIPFTHYFMFTPWADVINSRPHVKAWWEDISSRPATVKVSQGMKFG
ncbi:Glutathione S-transferase [Macleaya cordata]|uniref:glutathione transferase n=1 Tax=Macleaya cordata TaxID=56857 RepID=A0A200QWK4_MACCD|nr:Glutathione S-transferase [Macleaya cordata]